MPYGAGLEQTENAAASTWHSYPVTDSFAWNATVPLAAFEFALGAESNATVGATVSIVNVRFAVQADGSPVASCARAIDGERAQ